MSENSMKMIVDAELVPEVLLKVLEAKRMLSQGKARNASEAARLAGISRSAFYKYKDGVALYSGDRENKIVTYYLTLMDNPGVLSNVLSTLSRHGANVLTINQNIPIDGAAPVTISFSAGNLHTDGHTLREAIRSLDGVINCRSLSEGT